MTAVVIEDVQPTSSASTTPGVEGAGEEKDSISCPCEDRTGGLNACHKGSDYMAYVPHIGESSHSHVCWRDW